MYQAKHAPKTNAWTVELKDAELRNTTNSDNFRASGSKYAQFDTGYRYIFVPLNDYS
jgi:hypothetical protein